MGSGAQSIRPSLKKGESMRRATILFSAIAIMLVLVSGVVMAAVIKCPGRECLGKDDQNDTLNGSKKTT